MNQGFCTDKAALVGLLYDDCEPGERDHIAAHVANCPDCTAELASLSATRSQLAGWVTPHPALGFRVDPAQLTESLKAVPQLTVIEGGNDNPNRSGRAASPWWKQPLPAWAQAAAAVLIFAAGVGFGSGSSAGSDPTGSDGTRVQSGAADRSSRQAARPTPVAVTTTGVSPEELARLEQKLRTMQDEIAALRAGVGRPAPQVNEDAVTLAQLTDVVTTTKKELLQQFVLRDVAWQAAREDDLKLVEGLVGPIRAQMPVDRIPAYGPAYGLQRRPTATPASLTR